MKTFFALVAVSLLVSQSLGDNLPSYHGEQYHIQLQDGTEYNLTVLGANSESDDLVEGDLVVDDPVFSRTGYWQFFSGVLTEFSVYPEGSDSDTWNFDCQNGWPVMEFGETVSDPCWMSSTTGTPIQVTRTG